MVPVGEWGLLVGAPRAEVPLGEVAVVAVDEREAFTVPVWENFRFRDRVDLPPDLPPDLQVGHQVGHLAGRVGLLAGLQADLRVGHLVVACPVAECQAVECQAGWEARRLTTRTSTTIGPRA